jgi:hypothetical protein
MNIKTNNMESAIEAIELQKEKLEAIKFLLKTVQTDDNRQSTSGMLKDLQSTLYNLILSDF